MSNFQYSLFLDAPIEKVFAACASEAGLRSWWTKDCQASVQVGESIVVRFGGTYKVLLIDSLVPFAEIRWKVIEAYLDLPELERKDEWTGTTICMLLQSVSSTSSRLRLEHVGLNSSVECFDMCTTGWIHFLGSLKDYVEKGEGKPYDGVASTGL